MVTSGDVVGESPLRKRPQDDLKIVLDSVPEGLILHREGRLIYVNPAAAELLGYDDPREFLDRPIFDFIHPDDRARTQERMSKISLTGEPAPAAELRLLGRDGTVVAVEMSPVRAIQLEAGPANLVVFRDFTERNQLLDRLFLADRVASLGTLTAGVAHEINNPLTFVVGNLDMVARGLARLSASDGEAHEVREMEKAVADVRAGVERIRTIVGDLLAFSGPHQHEKQVVDLRHVLDGAINMAWPQIRHRARLIREYADAPLVYAEETRLGQVFLNLLINAAQAVDEGEINLNCIRVATRKDARGRAVVEVQDTGRGIRPSVSERIFDPFFTTKPAGVGTGLGLAIAKTIVTGLGGTISSESDGMSGALFTVVLPAASGSEPVPAKPVTSVSAPLQRARILVVDDEPVIAKMLQRALEEHDVYIVTSGQDALEFCREQAFDLVICDLMMPDVTGMDLYDQVSRHLPGLEQRIIFMTAGAFTERARDFLGQVSNVRIEKPFDLDEVRSVVNRFFESRPTFGDDDG